MHMTIRINSIFLVCVINGKSWRMGWCFVLGSTLGCLYTGSEIYMVRLITFIVVYARKAR